MNRSESEVSRADDIWTTTADWPFAAGSYVRRLHDWLQVGVRQMGSLKEFEYNSNISKTRLQFMSMQIGLCLIF